MKRFCLPLLLLLAACNAGKFYDKTYTLYDPAERRREREELDELRRKVAEYEGDKAPSAATEPKADDATAKIVSRAAQITAELDQLTARIRKGEDKDGALARRRSELESALVKLASQPEKSSEETSR